jgi:WD40 repeat protein
MFKYSIQVVVFSLIALIYLAGCMPDSKPVLTMNHKDCISGMVFHPDSEILATSSWDNTIILWDVEKGEKIRMLTGHTANVFCLAFSPDGESIVSGDDDGFIKIWKTSTGESIKDIPAHPSRVTSIKISPDGKTILSGCFNGTAGLWSMETGELIHLLNCEEDSIWSVDFGKDGKVAATGGTDSSIKLWDTKSGKQLRKIRTNILEIQEIAFSPDGKMIVACGSRNVNMEDWGMQEMALGGLIEIHDVITGSLIHSIEELNWIGALAFSSDGSQFAVGTWDSTVNIYDCENAELIRTIRGHKAWVWAVAFSPDGKYIASGDSHNIVHVWSTKEGNTNGSRIIKSDYADNKQKKEKLVTEAFLEIELESGFIHCLDITPDNKILLSSTFGGNSVDLWSTESGETKGKLKSQMGKGTIASLDVSPDGNYVAWGNREGYVEIWDLNTKNFIKRFTAHEAPINYISFSDDGSDIISSTYEEVKIWSRQTGDLQRTIKMPGVKILASCTGESGKKYLGGTKGISIEIWSYDYGNKICQLDGHYDKINSLDFSLDGKYIVSGSDDYTGKIWSVIDGQLIHSLEGHESKVQFVAYSPKGNVVATASRIPEEEALIWSVDTGELLYNFGGKDSHMSIRNIGFSNDGLIFATAGDETNLNPIATGVKKFGESYGVIKLWHL